ncbi:ParE toxin of type II toxin-antitoxin system, parDE [Methylobacterium phyllostachyos]|uniref:ParE toxin of type II toxin-antitoxin system, parDE n=1 Tax=Methylobacterium phyllostachyos TaxID=582672 RepID=A0A1H0BJ26_9HYPH|nr:type II toxin-antitoxin system RelE/ParE family toxin [Methylobacterium phyllostachyos]SDN45626.1 ParE toxin of type II toxin-antitoxin system, parDE [Methylobacterium phyllostachyos]
MKLQVQRRALQQIDRALSHIATQSPQGAAKVEARLTALIAVVRDHPYVGARTSMLGVRRLFLTPYPYHIDHFVGDDEIVVQRVRHTARKP